MRLLLIVVWREVTCARFCARHRFVHVGASSLLHIRRTRAPPKAFPRRLCERRSPDVLFHGPSTPKDPHDDETDGIGRPRDERIERFHGRLRRARYAREFSERAESLGGHCSHRKRLSQRLGHGLGDRRTLDDDADSSTRPRREWRQIGFLGDRRR